MTTNQMCYKSIPNTKWNCVQQREKPLKTYATKGLTKMRRRGLEPLRPLRALAPQASASADSATLACPCQRARIMIAQARIVGQQLFSLGEHESSVMPTKPMINKGFLKPFTGPLHRSMSLRIALWASEASFT